MYEYVTYEYPNSILVQRLLQALVKSGAAASAAKPDWQLVACAVGGERTPGECRVRHKRLVQNELENDLKPFTYAEDRLLLEHTDLRTDDGMKPCALRISAVTHTIISKLIYIPHIVIRVHVSSHSTILFSK